MGLATATAEVSELGDLQQVHLKGIIAFWLDLLFPLDPFYPIP